MRPLLVALVAGAVLAISVLFTDDIQPRDPFDASPPARPIDEIVEFLDEQIALN